MGLLRALIVLHRTYRAHPIRARVHILIRFLTCPFLRVLRALPRETRSLLEIGAGHGVFARLVAARGVARVVGVEPDVRKLHAIDGVSMAAAFDFSVGGSFDAIAILDVLYAIPIAEWDGILIRAYERLTPGGVLLIKEMDPKSIKNRWNAAQEWISMHMLHITLANAFEYETRDAFAERLRRLGFRGVTAKRVDFGYPHPHLLFVAVKPEPGASTLSS